MALCVDNAIRSQLGTPLEYDRLRYIQRLLWCHHFLLNVDQEGDGVIENYYRKTVRVHARGDQLASGATVNLALKIIR